MNFIGRHNHLGGYRRVNNTTFGIPLWPKDETPNFIKESVSWKWQKGSRVSTINDWLQIKIGGDEEVKKKKKRQKLNRIKSTKYTFITFLPQNLLEQFKRIANFYFLMMSIISLLIDSPVSPLTSLLPLVFVISVTAAKQGYEDFLRYKTDNIVNRSLVSVIRNGIEVNIESQDVSPGDLVLVERDCDVTCDLVLIRSSDPNGKCFITTANLDGETNLKMLTVPRDLPLVELDQMHKLGVIECESPKTDLYSFNGKIELSGSDGRVLPLSAENVLLRGSRVKNTECVIGCAVYTGMTTKLQLNSKLTRNKSASSEVYINRFLIFVLVALLVIVTVLYFLKRYYEMFVIPKMAYIGPPADVYSVKQFLQDYLSFLILFNYLIPISLYVTIEMHRALGGLFMEWDTQLYDETTDQHCIVNTSNLNEELGQVNILFSDKTGTLTKNEMIFQQCSIAGRKYKYLKTRLLEEAAQSPVDINHFNKDQKNFFQALTICHTVQVAGDVSRCGSQEQADNTTHSGALSPNGMRAFQQMNSISNITEESHSSSQHSDVNFPDTSPSADPNGEVTTLRSSSVVSKTANSDVNPLLVDKTTNIEKRKRPQVFKRSPNFARAARVHPTSVPLQGFEMGNGVGGERPTGFPSSLQTISTGRPLSMQFKRSTSEMDLPECNHNAIKSGILGHRRSKSYGAPGAYITQPDGTSPNILNRTSSTLSRESYAAPSFRRPQSMVIRAESLRRKNELQEVVTTLDYQASSPDEKALLEACAQLGLVYMGDDHEILKIREVPPHMDYNRPFSVGKVHEINFDRLHVLEFTSDRKRMSVIIKDENGDKWIYTKGAESYVFPLCNQDSSELITKTDAHISDFARLGLRTLAVARRKIPEQEYEEFLLEFSQSNISLLNRKELNEKAYAKIEKNLNLLGATAVEDALQDDVADTLVALQKAGIKIWVLTGDKVETALNIALSCGHIPQNALKYFITNCTRKEDMLIHLNALDREIMFGMGRDCALLIDGHSLTTALAETSTEFRDVSIKCKAVLCCRLSPLQKSEVVALIKTSNQNYNTASIGDGANDVSMIQEAHIGIGIMGKEGRQAARCADFAFAKFCMLKRLLLVHGHFHTARLSLLVLYFFYKNIFFMGAMFLFQFHTLFSSSSVYDSFFLTVYNVVYTSLPILFISATEKPYTEETLTREPELYQKNTNHKHLQWKFFLAWTLNAVYHSLIVFYFTFFIYYYNDVVLPAGQTSEFSGFGTLLMQMLVIVVNLKLWLESKYLSYWYIFTLVGSILAFVITTTIYNVINIRYDMDIYWAYNNLLCSISIWLLCILTTVACLLPDFTYRMAKRALKLPQRSFFPGAERLRLLRLRQKQTESTQL